jgi:hypothetical protein
MKEVKLLSLETSDGLIGNKLLISQAGLAFLGSRSIPIKQAQLPMVMAPILFYPLNSSALMQV